MQTHTASQPSKTFDGVQVFSATMVNDRVVLGEKVSAWIERNPSLQVVDIVVTQSSDDAFHCIAITVFYNRLATSS